MGLFGVLLLVADAHKSGWRLNGVESDVGGSGGRGVGKGEESAIGEESRDEQRIMQVQKRMF